MHEPEEMRELSNEEIASVAGAIFTKPWFVKILETPPLIDPLIDLPAPGPTNILFA